MSDHSGNKRFIQKAVLSRYWGWDEVDCGRMPVQLLWGVWSFVNICQPLFCKTAFPLPLQNKGPVIFLSSENDQHMVIFLTWELSFSATVATCRSTEIYSISIKF